VSKRKEEKKEIVQVATSRILEFIIIFNANGMMMMMTRMRVFFAPIHQTLPPPSAIQVAVYASLTEMVSIRLTTPSLSCMLPYA